MELHPYYKSNNSEVLKYCSLEKINDQVIKETNRIILF